MISLPDLQVKANNLQLFKPQTAWDLGPAATASLNSTQQQRQQPLHCMWELLTDALGYHTALDPHLAVAMLLSAAAAGGSNSQPVVARQREQVRAWGVWWGAASGKPEIYCV